MTTGSGHRAVEHHEGFLCVRQTVAGERQAPIRCLRGSRRRDQQLMLPGF